MITIVVGLLKQEIERVEREMAEYLAIPLPEWQELENRARAPEPRTERVIKPRGKETQLPLTRPVATGRILLSGPSNEKSLVEQFPTLRIFENKSENDDIVRYMTERTRYALLTLTLVTLTIFLADFVNAAPC
jgi:hypothetical protein